MEAVAHPVKALVLETERGCSPEVKNRLPDEPVVVIRNFENQA